MVSLKSVIIIIIIIIIIRQNIAGGAFAILSPTKLLGDMSPVFPRFRLYATVGFVLAHTVVGSCRSIHDDHRSHSDNSSSNRYPFRRNRDSSSTMFDRDMVENSSVFLIEDTVYIRPSF